MKNITIAFIILFSLLIFSSSFYFLLVNKTEKQESLNAMKDSPTQQDIKTLTPTQESSTRVYSPTLNPSPILITQNPNPSIEISPTPTSNSVQFSFPKTDTSSIMLIPFNTRFQNGQTQDFTLFMVPSLQDKSATVDYLKVEILYDQGQLVIPETAIINTSSSGFGKILRVDTPLSANKTGTLTIEMASSAPGNGISLSSPVKLAIIPFQAITTSVTQSSIKVGKTQAVGADLKAISLISQETNYSIE